MAYDFLNWGLFDIFKDEVPARVEGTSQAVLDMSPANQIYRSNYRTLTNVGVGGYDPKMAEAILTNPVFETTKQKMIDSGLLMDDRLTDTQKLAAATEVPMLQTLEPDVQSVFKNLGVDASTMSDTSSATTNENTVAKPVMGTSNMMNFLPFLMAASKNNQPTVTPMLTAVANPGLFEQREKDLYSMFRS